VSHDLASQESRNQVRKKEKSSVEEFKEATDATGRERRIKKKRDSARLSGRAAWDSLERKPRGNSGNARSETIPH